MSDDKETRMFMCLKDALAREDCPRVGDTFEHYKGNTYRVTGIFVHSETGEALVGYQEVARQYEAAYDLNPVNWVRPVSMFFDEVTVKVPRFKKVVT